MTAGELKTWRKRHGFTQGQAADALGISASDVKNFEREKSSIIPSAIQHACDSFDRRAALRSKIKDKIQSKGPPGHITPELLQEILLEIVDVIPNG